MEPTGLATVLRFIQEIAEVIEYEYEYEYEEGSGERPYEPYPAPGGLFLWANDWSGNQYFWDTSDPDPQRWPVVLWSADGEGFTTYPTGMAGFLADHLSGAHPDLTDFEDCDGPLWSLQ